MLDRNAEALDCAARGVDGAVIRLVLDVRDAEAVSDRHAQLRADHGDVDILVNNAGILSNHKSADTMPDEWRNIMAVNLDGAFWLSRLCLPAIIAPACIRTPMVTEQLTEAQRQELCTQSPWGGSASPKTSRTWLDFSPHPWPVSSLARLSTSTADCTSTEERRSENGGYHPENRLPARAGRPVRSRRTSGVCSRRLRWNR
jgi:NAD(P)-dependent dehydrogenase (short-subunit alcohol dehydrogenase family)